MVYKKKLLPKPVASDCMAPQSFLKHDYSEYTRVCPKEQLKKTAGFSNLRFRKNSCFSPCGNQVHVGDKPRTLWGAVFFFSICLFTLDPSVLLYHNHLVSGNDPLK